MRAIVTGGGTGGHIYPALAIAEGIKTRYQGADILYVGTDRGLEADIVPKAGYPFKKISVSSGFQRKLSLKNIKVLWQAGQGIFEARQIVRDFKPDIVIGTGGYVCGPVVMAAVMQKIPTLIHEQNAMPGVTNKILSRYVTQLAVTFEDSIARFPNQTRVKLTGLPVRPEIFSVDQQAAYQRLKLNPDQPVLLVFGGSRGARNINMSMIEVVKELQNTDIQILHATGKIGYQEYIDALQNAGISLDNIGNITTIPYLYNMRDALGVADLVVCRAGAATLAELTALGLPSVLIPYPYAAENHQQYNAQALVERGAARMILDKELTGELLLAQINELLATPNKLSTMAENSLQMGRPGALDDILSLIDKSCNI
ncbi:undecaprenyldiphospho-muramoylpentapeptide beta-N-acetylglucosaminyltransferase [Peptococcaceae bacterium 1198_IL3148]